MISSVATAAAVEQVAQERRRRQLQLAGEVNEAEKEPSLTSSEESVLCEEGPATQHTADTFDVRTHPSEFSPDALTSSQNDKEAQLQAADRVSITPAGRSKSQMLALATDATAPVPADPPDPASKAAPHMAVSMNPVARLVDTVLQLTNERFGASLRVQRKLAEEVLQGVAEAADESERGDSRPLSQARARRLSTQDNVVTGESLTCVIGSPKFAVEVEDAYKFDLMENNPNWKDFLTSSTGIKAQTWDAKRQEASNPCISCLYSPQRKWIYMTLSYPDYSLLAYWFGVFMIAVILLNTATFCFESVPRYDQTKLYNSLTVLDYVCMGIFTTEYLLRLLCCPDLSRFIRSLSNLIDLVAILPFFLELVINGSSKEAFQTRIVRLLRVFRVLRIVRSMPRLRHLTLVSDTLRDSSEVLIMMAGLLLVVLVVFGTIMYFVEPGTFDSIPEAIYYAQTTLTTTGYGDVYPVTPWGRFIAGAAMLLCMVVVSLPIALIGGNFSEKWSNYKKFKVAVDRSSGVYPTVRALLGELERYERVLDDVMRRLQECEMASEKQLQMVREDIAAGRTALIRGGSGLVGGLAPASLSGVVVGSRIFHVAKNVMRRVRGGSNSAITRHGSYTTLPRTTMAPSPQSSAVNLVDTGDGAIGIQEQNPQKDLRTAAALTARSASQQEAVAGEMGGAGVAEVVPQRNRRFKAIVSSVINNRRGQGPEGISNVSEPVPGKDRSAAAGTATAVIGGTALADDPEHTHVVGGSPTTGRNSQAPRSLMLLQEPSTMLYEASSHLNIDDEDMELPLPPPPQPPVPPVPPAPSPPPPQQPPGNITSYPSLGGSSAEGGALVASSISLSGFARYFANSVATLWSRKSEAIAVEAAGSSVRCDSGEGAPSQLPVEPVAREADVRLERAAEGCNRARNLRIRHVALAAQAHILQTDGMPAKLEKLDEQYRLLRCWQDELGPLAERMWCLRDALDELAWGLQEGLSEEEKKYSPGCREARTVADAGLGVLRRRTSVYTDTTNQGGSMRAGAGSAVTILRPEGVVDGSTRAGSRRASVASLPR